MNPKNGTIFAAIALALIVVATAIRPGDAPWIFDEPVMMDMAFVKNAQSSKLYGPRLPFTPAPFGLEGTRGVRYGPLPIWIDQMFLAITHNPFAMVVIRAALSASITAAALFWLTKTMGLNPWLAVVTMLSPWLWFYSRQLWDNSLCIPLSAIALAAYADFLKSRRSASIRIALVSASLLPLIHLMSVALLVPLALHFFIVEYRQVWKFKWSLLTIVIVWGGISWPYWFYTFHHFHKDIPWGSSPTLGFFYPLYGGQHLTASGLENLLGDDWRESNPSFARNILAIAIAISRLAYLAAWSGTVLAIPKAWQALRHPRLARPIEHLLLIALATLICQSILDGFEHIDKWPHYFNATWMIYLIFAWTTVESVRHFLASRKFPSSWLLPVYGTSLLVVVLIIAFRVAHDGGTRSDNYGASLASQFDAAARINQFSADSQLHVEFSEWKNQPDSRTVLQRLAGARKGDRPRRLIIVRLRNQFPSDARVIAEDFPPLPDADVPPPQSK